MRYPNPTDMEEHECYYCSDWFTGQWGSKYGDTWVCIPCRIDDIKYSQSIGGTVRPLTSREKGIATRIVNSLLTV